MNGIEESLHYLEAGIDQFPDGSLRLVLTALLGLTLLWSGISKARSPWNAAFALVDFGIVQRPQMLLTWSAILGELGIASALLIGPAISPELVQLTTTVAACTLLLFAALIARALLAGRSFACSCFGSEGEEITGATLVRTVTLTLLALCCAAAGPPQSPLSLSDIVLTWSAAAAALGIGVMAAQIRHLLQLPQPCSSA